MPDQPHQDVLDRAVPSIEVREHFGDAVDLVGELADYGTNLLVRCLGVGSQ
jgi:hypothetical protein